MEFISSRAQETKDFGARVASQLKGGEVLALVGELGSGKTTFVQGLAEGLGVKQRVLSPTYILVRSYPVKNRDFDAFYHVDLYRIEQATEVEGLGLEEVWSDPSNVMVIEWAEKIEESLPSDAVWIYFSYVGEKERKIVMRGNV